MSLFCWFDLELHSDRAKGLRDKADPLSPGSARLVHSLCGQTPQAELGCKGNKSFHPKGNTHGLLLSWSFFHYFSQLGLFTFLYVSEIFCHKVLSVSLS